jgi:hypothetical protein
VGPVERENVAVGEIRGLDERELERRGLVVELLAVERRLVEVTWRAPDEDAVVEQRRLDAPVQLRPRRALDLGPTRLQVRQFGLLVDHREDHLAEVARRHGLALADDPHPVLDGVVPGAFPPGVDHEVDAVGIADPALARRREIEAAVPQVLVDEEPRGEAVRGREERPEVHPVHGLEVAAVEEVGGLHPRHLERVASRPAVAARVVEPLARVRRQPDDVPLESPLHTPADGRSVQNPCDSVARANT